MASAGSSGSLAGLLLPPQRSEDRAQRCGCTARGKHSAGRHQPCGQQPNMKILRRAARSQTAPAVVTYKMLQKPGVRVCHQGHTDNDCESWPKWQLGEVLQAPSSPGRDLCLTAMIHLEVELPPLKNRHLRLAVATALQTHLEKMEQNWKPKRDN